MSKMEKKKWILVDLKNVTRFDKEISKKEKKSNILRL